MRIRKELAKKRNLFLTTFFFTFITVITGAYFLSTPVITNADKEEPAIVVKKEEVRQGKYVVIYLNTMTLELRDGETILKTLPLLSQGKPGSYYETIGGVYINDYKEPLHFSSIGHVYMPFSIHLFGNYFIHGVPYYPDGRQVSSAYSGGCVRLENNDAETVYNFIEKGMPIVVTRDTGLSFNKTEEASSTLTSTSMTNLMVASIALEHLTQDNPITSPEGTITTRRELLPRLVISGDEAVAHLYENALGEKNFVTLMNKKAEALGLTNTHFVNTTSPVATTYEDYERFMTYISVYKSYLRTIENTDNGPLH